MNSGAVALLDDPAIVVQFVGLERRTSRAGRDAIDHAPGRRHDDLVNAIAGALIMAKPTAVQETSLGLIQVAAGAGQFGGVASGVYSNQAEADAFAGEGHGAFAQHATSTISHPAISRFSRIDEMEHDFAKSIADAEQLISDLERRHVEAQGAVAALIERRKPLALGAATGDEASHKMLARLADEERAAEMRFRDLGFAIDGARHVLVELTARATAADREQRQAAYAAHSAIALDAARQMDEAARALAAAQRRLRQAHADLSATGLGNSGALNRLIYRAGMTRALVSHGFAAFTDLPRFGDPLGNQGFEALVEGVVGAARSTREAA